MAKRPAFFHASLLAIVMLFLIWSAIRPADRFTWFLEVMPVLIAVPVLLISYKSFRFTTLIYSLICVHAVILIIGGHYTYAQVPLFNWLKDILHQSRNNYDKVGHFIQGFVPAMIAREVLLRKSRLVQGKWLFFIVVCICLAISAAYELFEWGAAELIGTAADAFLGTQGDIWDTQKDMAFALIGAVTSLIALSGFHDKELAALSAEIK